MGELLHHAYRVFAVYLLVLLLVNLFFPDNLYAKGSSSSSSRSGSSYSSSSSDSAPFHGFAFSSPGTQYGTFRYRPAFAGPYGASRSGTGRVYDPEGREHPALRFSFTDPQGTRKPVASVLALTPELQLLDSGAVVCTPAVPGYQCLLEPGGIRVLDAASRPIVTLRPSARLLNDAAARTRAQLAAVERAVGEHQRWLDWVRWGTAVAPGREAVSEMEALGAMRRALQTAHATWSGAPPGTPATTLDPPPDWTALFPGVYLEGPTLASQDPTVVWASADGSLRRQSVDPPAQLTDPDRFLFRLLQRRLTEGQDQSLSRPVARWIETHGSALGVRS
jgi:hypothetical protein